MRFGKVGRMGQKNGVLDRGPDPPTVRSEIFGDGNGAAQCNVKGERGTSHAKLAELIELPFETVSRVTGQKNRALDSRAHWRHLANTVERLYARKLRVMGLTLGLATRPVSACRRQTDVYYALPMTGVHVMLPVSGVYARVRQH